MLWLGSSVLIAGILVTTFRAPCSAAGVYISAAGVAVTGAARVAMLARSIQQRTKLRWVQFACAIAATLIFTCIASFWTLLLCRAV